MHHRIAIPEEVLEEAFGELDQLDAAMLQLAPRKFIFISKYFLNYYTICIYIISNLVFLAFSPNKCVGWRKDVLFELGISILPLQDMEYKCNR